MTETTTGTTPIDDAMAMMRRNCVVPMQMCHPCVSDAGPRSRRHHPALVRRRARRGVQHGDLRQLLAKRGVLASADDPSPLAGASTAAGVMIQHGGATMNQRTPAQEASS